jgi:hypothetical protein
VTTPSRDSIAALPRGHRFPAATFRISPEGVARYLDAVQDRSAACGDAAPPLAVAALALRALLERLELPAGSLHAAQDVECRAAVPLNAELTMRGEVAQRSERGGFVAAVIEFEVAAADSLGEPVLVGRTTVMAPRPTEG